MALYLIRVLYLHLPQRDFGRMTLPEWKIISKYGSQVISHLPELSDLAIAEVDADGVIVSINRLGQDTWGWREGQRLPNAISIALAELKKGESLMLPVKPGGLNMLAVRMEGAGGWLLIGYFSREERLAERASTFKSLIEKIPVLITRMRADGTVLYANAESERMTGYPTDEIVGRPFWLEAVHPEDRWKLMGAVRRAVEGDRAVVGVRFLTKFQGPRFAEMHLYPDVQSGEGQVEGVVFDVTERSEIEEALFQSEALYRIFLEQSPIGMLHLDAAGTVTFENHQFRQIIGESVEDAWIGRSIFSIEGLNGGLKPLLRRVLEEGDAIHGKEVRYAVERAQRLYILNVHGSPIRHPEGGIVGAVLMIEDRTQQKLRDEELELRHRYSQAESSLRKAALSDPDEGAFLQEAARILGETSRAERTCMLVHYMAGSCCMSRAVWTAGGAIDPEPIQIQHRDHPVLRALENDHRSLHAGAEDPSGPGNDLLQLTNASEAIWAPFFEEGQLGGFVLFEHRTGGGAWNVTEQQLIEQLVRLFETLWAWIQVGDRYRQIVGSIDDCLFNYALDQQGERRYLFVTHQIQQLVGVDVDDVIGRGGQPLHWLEEVVHEDDRAAVHRHDEQLRGGQDSRIVYRIEHRSGQMRWLSEHGTPQRDAMGSVVVSGILTDVTEQKLSEAVLLEAKQQAESANKLKSVFIATMSHEIRTPMGAVNGFAELLYRELADLEEESGRALPPQVTEFLQAIRENSQKLLTLVNDLFDLSNLEVGSAQLRQMPVPLDDLVMRSTSKVAVHLSQKGVDLRVDLDPTEPVVLGDAQRLEQILDILLSNAVKFTDEGSVTVRTRRMEGGRAAIEVTDTGVGISCEYLDHLFTPFQQEDNRLNRRYEGSGLGLSLARRLLDLMDGKIEVKSAKGDGSTFRISLAMAAGLAPRRRSTRSEEQA